MSSLVAVDKRWKSTFDAYDAPSIGRGSSGSILAINKSLVIKVFADDDEGQMDLERETSIFEILQTDTRSPYIVNFIEQWQFGLVMERLECSLRTYLRQKSIQSVGKVISWVDDACKGLDFLHTKGIMHGDVGCHNFLVSEELHLKLCDFAGSKREGETARICYEVRGQHPNYQSGQPTRTTELFALVSFPLGVTIIPLKHPGLDDVRDLYFSASLC
jgi:serine/threonine protein kinase